MLPWEPPQAGGRTTGAPCTDDGTGRLPCMERRRRDMLNLSATCGSLSSSIRCDLHLVQQWRQQWRQVRGVLSVGDSRPDR